MSRKNRSKLEQLYHASNLLIQDSNLHQVSYKLYGIFEKIKLKIEEDKNDSIIGIGPIDFSVLDDDEIKTFQRRNTKIIFGGLLVFRDKTLSHQALQLCISVNETKGNNNASKLTNANSCCLKKYGDGVNSRIIRKFHFDYQEKIKDGNTRSNIIDTHLQYGGKFTNQEKIKNIHYCLDHWLEKPRFYFPPMDLILLIEFIIREFRTDLSILSRNSKWRKLVIESEELYWKDYFKNLLSCKKDSIHEIIYQ